MRRSVLCLALVHCSGSAPPAEDDGDPDVLERAQLVDAQAPSGAYDPRVVVDDEGNAIVVYTAYASGVWSSVYRPATGWEAPVAIGDAGGDAWSLEIVRVAGSEAFAAWAQWENGYPRAWANRFDPALGWGAPVTLARHELTVGTTSLAAMAEGRAVVVFDESNEGGVLVQSSTFDLDAGWSAVETLALTDTRWWTVPHVGADLAGGAWATWREAAPEGSTTALRVSHFSADSGWSTPETAMTLPTAFAQSLPVPQPDGALVVVAHDIEQGGSLWTAARDAGGTWTSPTELPADLVPLAVPGLSVRSDGTAVLAWPEPAGVWAAELAPGDGWSAPRALHDREAASSGVRVSTGAPGIATIAWLERDRGWSSVWLHRLDAAAAPSIVWPEISERAWQTDVAMAGSGDAMLVWTQGNGNAPYWGTAVWAKFLPASTP